MDIFEEFFGSQNESIDNEYLYPKAGLNAKWYFKKININEIEEKIEKQKWRDTHKYTMYIIEWDE
jgi:hypothetical protein